MYRITKFRALSSLISYMICSNFQGRTLIVSHANKITSRLN